MMDIICQVVGQLTSLERRFLDIRLNYGIIQISMRSRIVLLIVFRFAPKLALHMEQNISTILVKNMDMKVHFISAVNVPIGIGTGTIHTMII